MFRAPGQELRSVEFAADQDSAAIDRKFPNRRVEPALPVLHHRDHAPNRRIQLDRPHENAGIDHWRNPWHGKIHGL